MPEPLRVPAGCRLRPEYCNGLVGHWKMNVNSGLLLPDLSGKGNHGTLTKMANPPTATSGWAGQGLSFDGVDDWVANPFQSFITKSGVYTFSAWIKFSGQITGSSGTIFQNSTSGSDRNGMNIDTNILRFGYYDTSWHGKTGAISTGVWTHITGVNNSGTLSLYVNGVLQTGVASPFVSSVATYMYIGKSTRTGAPYYEDLFNGLIDDVRIYNRALSADEVAHAYFQQEDEWDFGDDEIW